MTRAGLRVRGRETLAGEPAALCCLDGLPTGFTSTRGPVHRPQVAGWLAAAARAHGAPTAGRRRCPALGGDPLSSGGRPGWHWRRKGHGRERRGSARSPQREVWALWVVSGGAGLQESPVGAQTWPRCSSGSGASTCAVPADDRP